MQTTKLKGIINKQGQLILEERINLNPGEVEIVILQKDDLTNKEKTIKSNSIKFRNHTFTDLLETQLPVDEDFNPDAVKWSYLEEKYNL